MPMNEMQKQTNANIQAKANLIWEIATHLVGLFKPHEYGKVILPMTVLKRFDDALKPTKAAVVEMAKKLDAQHVEGTARDGILCRVAQYDFYNTSNYDFAKLIADPDNVESNFDAYLQGFSSNIKDIIENFDFANTVKLMVKGGVLFVTLQEFNSAKADMSPEKITSADMGYIFEELIRKFSESYDEQAGAHFTSRDIIYLMTELLVAPEKAEIMEEGCTKTAYDMAMGTSQMLGCLTERLQAISEDAALTCFGQEFNPETYAIAKADMLIKGGNASGMKYGDTLSDDAFTGYEFDYIISNPPFGIDWKREKTQVEAEAKKGFDGRFGPGLPAISDGQMLFMLNGVKKLKPGSGRMAIIQNGSSLFTGDAGSGASEIRRYVIEGDLVEAIIQLPTDLFYNTGISTYIWVLTKGKAMHRSGKVQLIDASKCFVKRRKNIGSKRVDLDDACIELIIQAYEGFANKTYEENGLTVESKVFDKEFFGFTKVTVETAQADENGKPILKKGKRQPVKGASDTEIIPLSEDIDAYIKKNVLPYNPQVEAEAKKGFDGRFGAGLPAISDGQMLFMLNGVKKLKPGSGRMAIIQNGSSLFTGDAGSGASEIRRYVIEGDLVEAIIQLPTDLFYNTGISTYIWVLTKGKAMHRSGKVQLIDASKCFVKRRKNIGSKRVDLDDACIELIIQAYEGFANKTYEENGLTVESKVFDKEFFGFTKVTVETAQADENGKPILKKGKRQPVKGASDTEIIPLSEDIDAYIKKNVLPYNPLAYIDPAKDKTGYEVPFTRLFYKFTQPTPSAEIFEEIKALEDEETILMKELFGNA